MKTHLILRAIIIGLIMMACGAARPERSPTAQLVTFKTQVSTATPTLALQVVEVPPTTQPTPSPTTELVEAEQPARSISANTLPLLTAGADNVNIRSGPGTAYEIIGKLTVDQSLEIVGRTADSSWWQVATPNGSGWVAAEVTTASDVGDNIPVVEVAPPVETAPVEVVSAPAGLQEAQVTNVVDGDTIDVLINGAEYRVRYILVDTPETVHPSKPVQPFGPEASEANRQLVEGKTVWLEKDVSETDQYGRLLRYVYLDSLLINEELLRLGLAQVTTFPPDVKYVDRFLEVQRQAQAAAVGLWGSQSVAEQATATPVSAEPLAPTPTPIEAQPAPTGGSVIISNIFYDGQVKQVESDEYVEIANQGGEPVDVSGWKINAGDPGQDFVFPSGFVLQAGQTCRVYTNETHSESCGFSFGTGRAIWNNDGDVGVLYNAQGEAVSEKGY